MGLNTIAREKRIRRGELIYFTVNPDFGDIHGQLLIFKDIAYEIGVIEIKIKGIGVRPGPEINLRSTSDIVKRVRPAQRHATVGEIDVGGGGRMRPKWGELALAFPNRAPIVG